MKAFEIKPAAHCKGDQVVVVPAKSEGHFASQAEFLARQMGRYSGRYKGYVMPAKRAGLLWELWAEGWRGCICDKGFIPPNGNYDCRIRSLTTVKRYRRRKIGR